MAIEQVRATRPAEPTTAPTVVRTLVMSEHEAVRRQLVTYLGCSPWLDVTGVAFGPESIAAVRPDVLVLDLSRISRDGLDRAIRTARGVGARLVALASMPDAEQQRAVIDAGGRYCLKTAGAGDLAEIVNALAARPGPVAARAGMSRDHRAAASRSRNGDARTGTSVAGRRPRAGA